MRREHADGPGTPNRVDDSQTWTPPRGLPLGHCPPSLPLIHQPRALPDLAGPQLHLAQLDLQDITEKALAALLGQSLQSAEDRPRLPDLAAEREPYPGRAIHRTFV